MLFRKFQHLTGTPFLELMSCTPVDFPEGMTKTAGIAKTMSFSDFTQSINSPFDIIGGIGQHQFIDN